MTYGFSLSDVPSPEEMLPVEWDFARDKAIKKPLSILEKYWGIEALLETEPDGSVWKLIQMHPCTQSSLEYHVTKSERYYILQGELKVGVRIGRATNYSFPVRTGQRWEIPLGLMHMRSARQSVRILEWASHNDPKDSHLVEDGRFYNHVVEE